MLYQQWRNVVFLHWEVDPEAVARRLPAGTWPDLLDGKAYAAVVAFLMPTTRLLGRVPVGATVEVNTRVYSVDANGRHGTVFLSMDVSLATMALAGRVLARLALRLVGHRGRVAGRHRGIPVPAPAPVR